MLKTSRWALCLLLTFVLIVSPIFSFGGIDTSESAATVTETGVYGVNEPVPGTSGQEENGLDSIPERDGRGMTTFFSDDVESGDPGYTTGQDAGSSAWTIQSNGAQSGSFSWDFGNGNYLDPGAGGLSWLISPDIVIPSNALDAELSFWHWRDFESNARLYDGGNVKLSNSGTGGPWVLITPTPPYDGPTRNGNNNPLIGEDIYGHSSGWENVTYDLGSYIGDTINIRWDAGADSRNSNDQGWRIDDILVYGNTPDIIPLSLTIGWNLISLPVIQDNTSIDAVFSSISGQWEYAMWYNATDPLSPWESNSVLRSDSLDELWDIDHKMGVWLKVTEACTLNVEGTQADIIVIPLYAGWNLVGYPSLTPISAIDTLPLDMVDMVAVADPANPYLIQDSSDLASVTMEPGKGYWVHSIADTIWVIVTTTTSPIRNIAEFERMQGVLIRYPLGLPYSVVTEMAENDTVYTIVANIATRDAAISNYGSNGVNLSNCEWIIAPSNSHWTRDYGPWWITDGNDDIGIVDFTYNRPARPDDNNIPSVASGYLGVPLDFMNIEHTGGNYMTDGLGISISTDLVLSENLGYTKAQVDQLLYDHLGIDLYHTVPDANGEYIAHIDCWAKYLDVDKIMVREVPPAHDRYFHIESAVANFSTYTSSYGTPYEIYRVWTPNDEPYTNCLILNNKVLVPITGGAWDAAAIASYQTAMPGYEVLGFTELGSAPWDSTDALHCRAKGIPDLGMLYIQHYPVIQPQPDSTPIEITANITAYSMNPLNTYDVYWKLSTDIFFNVLPMSYVNRDQYRAFIPGQTSGSTIQYYIQATDGSGRSETSPIIGEPDPHVFTIL